MSIVNVKITDLGGTPVKNVLVSAVLRRIAESQQIVNPHFVPSSDVGNDQWLANIAAGDITNATGDAVLELEPNDSYDVGTFYEIQAQTPFPLNSQSKTQTLWVVYVVVPDHDSHLRFVATKPGADPTYTQIVEAGFVETIPTLINVVEVIQDSENSIRKDGLNAAWDGGADSDVGIVKDTYGYVEATPGDTDKAMAFGLSTVGGDLNITGITYGVSFKSDGNYEIIESGVSLGSPVAYLTGDVFRVEKDYLGVGKIYKNDIAVNTSSLTLTDDEPLKLVISMFDTDAQLNDLIIAGDELE